MSKISSRRFHTPFNNAAIKYVIGWMFRARSEQAVAATLATAVFQGGVATHDGSVHSVSVISSAVAGAGESMVIDVFKNGVSILPGTFTFDVTKAGKAVVEIPFTPGTSIAVGDILTTTRTYTAGGTPTMVATAITVEWGPAH